MQCFLQWRIAAVAARPEPSIRHIKQDVHFACDWHVTGMCNVKQDYVPLAVKQHMWGRPLPSCVDVLLTTVSMLCTACMCHTHAQCQNDTRVYFVASRLQSLEVILCLLHCTAFEALNAYLPP